MTFRGNYLHVCKKCVFRNKLPVISLPICRETIFLQWVYLQLVHLACFCISFERIYSPVRRLIKKDTIKYEKRKKKTNKNRTKELLHAYQLYISMFVHRRVKWQRAIRTFTRTVWRPKNLVGTLYGVRHVAYTHNVNWDITNWDSTNTYRMFILARDAERTSTSLHSLLCVELVLRDLTFPL